MTQEFFATQLKRLTDVYGDKAYPAERIKLIFAAIRNEPDHWLEKFVNHAIGNMKTAPMLKDFTDDAADSKRREANSRFNDTQGDGSIAAIIGRAAAQTKANPEFVKACIKLLAEKDMGKITAAQFEEGCDLLDQAAALSEGAECPRCANTGYVVHEHRLFRCSCDFGKVRAERILGPPERDGTRTEHLVPMMTRAQFKARKVDGKERATGEHDE